MLSFRSSAADEAAAADELEANLGCRTEALGFLVVVLAAKTNP